MYGPEYLPFYIGTIVFLLILMLVQAVNGKYHHAPKSKSTFVACKGGVSKEQDSMAAAEQYVMETRNDLDM